MWLLLDVNTIDYVTIASAGNAIDFGDLLVASCLYRLEQVIQLKVFLVQELLVEFFRKELIQLLLIH
jgi:hypothetical protein